MRFIGLVPYSQLEIDIIESLGGCFQEFYANEKELLQDNPDSEYTKIEVEGLAIELDCGFWLSMDSIGIN
tara:strand:+ start:665 stop:874 length:210 start_codon:yes stop_codon:yes gene_type:complete